MESEEAMTYLKTRLDYAVDLIDKGYNFIEEKEFKEINENTNASEVMLKKEDKKRKEVVSQRCFIEISIEERLARKFCRKTYDITNGDVHLTENLVLMKTYLGRLTEILETLQHLWKEFVSLQETEDEANKTVDDIFKDTIEDTITL